MGVSTDASIAYGVDLGEYLDLEELDLTDAELEDPHPSEILEGRLTAHIEDPRPDWYWNEYPSYGEDDSKHKQWREEHADEVRAYYAARNAAIDAFPFEFDTHCSDEAPMYMLVARGSTLTASRGNPKALDEGPSVSWSETPAWPIDSLFEVFDIRPALEEGVDLTAPQWLLYSYWG